MKRTEASSRDLWSGISQRIGRYLDYALSGWRKGLITAFFAALTILIIAYAIVSNWELFKSQEWAFRPHWLFWAIVFLFLDMFLGAWVWHRLASQLASSHSARQNIKIWWYANLGRRVPGTVWYIAGRAALYDQIGISKLTITMLSGLELALIFVSGIVMTLITIPFWALPAEFVRGPNLALILLVTVPLTLVLIRPNVLVKIWRKLSGQSSIQVIRLRDTLTWLLLYLLVWLVGALVLFSVVNVFHTLPVTQLAAAIGMWSLASSLSLAGALTFTGLGIREVSLTFLLTILIPLPIALITSIAVRLLWLAAELVTAMFALRL